MKRIHSLAELGPALGVSKKKRDESQREKKCKVCGTVMQNIPGTNVFVCNGTTEEKKPCSNYALSSSF